MKSEMHMSNLNLPSLKYTDLMQELVMLSSEKKVAYKTTVQRVGVAVYVRHHGSVIATLLPGNVVKVDTCGWDSMTTSQRISKVLRDNDVPFAVSIRKGKTTLLARPTLAPVARLTTATFQNGELV